MQHRGDREGHADDEHAGVDMTPAPPPLPPPQQPQQQQLMPPLPAAEASAAAEASPLINGTNGVTANGVKPGARDHPWIFSGKTRENTEVACPTK